MKFNPKEIQAKLKISLDKNIPSLKIETLIMEVKNARE